MCYAFLETGPRTSSILPSIWLPFASAPDSFGGSNFCVMIANAIVAWEFILDSGESKLPWNSSRGVVKDPLLIDNRRLRTLNWFWRWTRAWGRRRGKSGRVDAAQPIARRARRNPVAAIGRRPSCCASRLREGSRNPSGLYIFLLEGADLTNVANRHTRNFFAILFTKVWTF